MSTKTAVLSPDRAAFAAIVAPLTIWSDDGSVWGVAIQNGKLTEDPSLDAEWSEVRLERSSEDPNVWSLWYAPDDASGWEVYYGRIPNRSFWVDLLTFQQHLAPHTHVLLGGERPFDCGHVGFLSIYSRLDGGSQCTGCANEMRRAYAGAG